MKLTVWRLLAFLLLIVLSVGFGLGFDAIATAVDRYQYPCPNEYADEVRGTAERYALPEAVVWGFVRNASGFESNAVQGNAIGLMQLTPQEFTYIRTELLDKESTESGLLYDPAANLEAGCAYLSHLYQRYGTWELTLAAFCVGTDTVDAWLTNPDLVDDRGVLPEIPDAAVRDYVDGVMHTIERYRKLYF